ncbi:helix-turn-helix transcriptional regulator [Clostridium sporogenes]|uniref:helix-turn-helix domain-containing protein n=1 Tax=Clostridium sporogenes TaxID=1509 RepID=UPI0013D23E7D|nr:helix-turn-helix transcriptional regulator [Clostridium sporogenes]NFQ84137.1 helix-turn-helix transcriptional regulator [Clostridium sporogenes]
MKHKINIEKYRKENFISQNKLAKKIGISQSYLSAIIREEKSPTLRMLYRIADELDVCPRLLLKCTIECSECNKKWNCVCEGENGE